MSSGGTKVTSPAHSGSSPSSVSEPVPAVVDVPPEVFVADVLVSLLVPPDVPVVDVPVSPLVPGSPSVDAALSSPVVLVLVLASPVVGTVPIVVSSGSIVSLLSLPPPVWPGAEGPHPVSRRATSGRSNERGIPQRCAEADGTEAET